MDFKDALRAERGRIDDIDKKIASLFQERQERSRFILKIKEEAGLPVVDPVREAEVRQERLSWVDEEHRPAFGLLVDQLMRHSKDLQDRALLESRGHAPLFVDGLSRQYPVWIGHEELSQIQTLVPSKEKVFLLTDSGVPASLFEIVAALVPQCEKFMIPRGEKIKSFPAYEVLIRELLERGFNRQDWIIALGGGMVNDLAGFVAATYMRGIRWISVPTTRLAQVDASIGGKTALNVDGIKNVCGAFYPPTAVFIDPSATDSLPARQKASGMAEIIKMAASFDPDLFEDLENGAPYANVIRRAIALKKMIIEQDERENGPRRLLNFGHTVGHAIESVTDLLHGESVAVGMTYFAGVQVFPRLEALLRQYDLPTRTEADPSSLMAVLRHDKKSENDRIMTVQVDAIGAATLVPRTLEEIEECLNARTHPGAMDEK